MKRFVTVRSFILVFALLLGMIPVSATERPFASNGNGVAAFITDGAGNVVGANLTLSGHGTHLGLFTGTGKIQFVPDANDPNIVHVPGEITLYSFQRRSSSDSYREWSDGPSNWNRDRRHGVPKRHWPFRRSKWKCCNRSRAELRHGRLHVHHGWKHQLLIQPDHTLVFQVGLVATPALLIRPGSVKKNSTRQ